jgi:hypothetical protein
MTLFTVQSKHVVLGIALLFSSELAVASTPAIVRPLPPTVPVPKVTMASTPAIVRPLPPTVPVPKVTMASTPAIVRPLPPTIPSLA